MSAHIVVFITMGSIDEGRKIARTLVEEQLAACVNILPAIESVYRWEGQVQSDREVLLIVKTAAVIIEQLAARVRQLHSYEVPEIIALPIVAGSQDYLSWVDEQVQPAAKAPRTFETH